MEVWLMIECHVTDSNSVNPKQLYCTYRLFEKAPEVFLRVLASEQLRFLLEIKHQTLFL